MNGETKADLDRFIAQKGAGALAQTEEGRTILERSAILYGSAWKLTNAHKPVYCVTPNPPHGATKQRPYYVRMTVVNCGVEDALNRAQPQPGEIVLNTVPL